VPDVKGVLLRSWEDFLLQRKLAYYQERLIRNSPAPYFHANVTKIQDVVNTRGRVLKLKKRPLITPK
jgi:hypothetical protein